MDMIGQAKEADFNLAGLPVPEEGWRVLLDNDQRIVLCGEESFRWLGRRPEELLGQRLGQVLNLGLLRAYMVRGVAFRDQPVWVGDDRYYCQYLPLRRDGRPAGGCFTLLHRDQVGRGTLEVPELLVHFAEGGELAGDSLILVDTEGTISLISQTFADALELSAAEMLGRPVLEAYPNSNPSRLPVVMERGEAEEAEPHILNGRQAIVSRYPLFVDGKMVGASGKILFRDASQLLRAAEKVQVQVSQPLAKKRPARRRSAGVHCYKYDCNSIIGQSRVMKTLKERLLRIAARPSNVLLLGESGTGKELFAHAVHAASRRRSGPFVRVNCAAIPEHLLESELFGYVDGAFTGARKGGQVGKFEQAHGGTVFLDEISDMPLLMQAKLLRVLQEREITPLGGTENRSLDVRVIAATNVDLEERVRDGRFRADLYYRLNVVSLEIPPLRRRREDIYFITKHLIDNFNCSFGLAVEDLEEEAWQLLQNYDFPGNVRELRNAIESAFNLVDGPLIRAADLPDAIRRSGRGRPVEGAGAAACEQLLADVGRRSLQEILEDLERQLIVASLERAGGNKLNAAHVLGISRPGLYKKLNKYNLQ
ncbi:MAG: PAS domain-containing protein [Deltaproteobacteria bacterium]|nr:MAG: PAS domain-containing protein [Deltaproteobacteria bacterium]